MKVKLLTLVLLVAMFVTSLAACSIFKKPGDDDNADGNSSQSPSSNITQNGEYIVFSPNISVTIVKTSNKDVNLDVLSFTEDVFALTNKICVLNNDSSPVEGNEIIFGDTTRDLTKKAYEQLEASLQKIIRDFEDQGRDTKHIAAYTIYSEGGSVAIVWNDDVAMNFAFDYFREKYLTSNTLALKDGYVDTQAFSALEYYEAEDERILNESFAKVEEVYGKDVVSALKSYLAMFDERFYFWLADLYDPGEYDENGNPLGGGFYATNSGRDTSGYLYDIETTRQVFSFLESSGMFKNGSVKELTPKKMQDEIITFVLSCQSSVDGYFYHPVWGTNVIDRRRDRDLSSAIQLLDHFGVKPLWDTPNGRNGTYGQPTGEVAPASLTSPLSTSATVIAASKVMATAGNKAWTGSAYLKTVKAWEEFILSYEDQFSTNSYSIGSDFSSRASQVRTRDTLAIENGELPDKRDINGNPGADGIADGGYIETFKRIFDSWQFEKSGLWEDCSLEEDNIYYQAINGLMKITSAYNSLGLIIPNYEKAFLSAAHMVTFMGDDEWRDCKGKQPTAIVDTFNTWTSLSYILGNLKKHGMYDEVERLKNIVKPQALEMIRVTVLNVTNFEKDNGSYGYRWGAGSGKNQGAPVGIPNTNEGDVNGGCLCYTGVFKCITNVLDINYLTPLGHSDLIKFFDRIEELEHVMKDPDEIPFTDIITFDDDITGASESDYVRTTINRGSVLIKEDEREKGGNVLQLISKPDGTNYIFAGVSEVIDGSCLVLEWEMCFTDIRAASSPAYQIKLSDAYMLCLSITTDGVMSLYDSSATSGTSVKTTFDIKLNAFEWNKFRIEHYVIDTEEKETATKIYINDQLRCLSSNYTNSHDPEAMPSTAYITATFLALKATDFTVLFDDIYAYHSKDKYVEEEIDSDEKIKDFDSVALGNNMPTGVVSEDGMIISSPTEKNPNNQALLLENEASATSTSVKLAPAPNCYSLNTKMKISGSGADAGKIYLGMSSNIYILAYSVEIYTEGDMKYARLTEITDKGKGESFDEIPVDEWFELTIEFYPYRYLAGKSSVIYVNGDEIGRGNSYYTINTLARAYSYAIFQSGESSSITLDDIKAVSIFKTYVDENGEKFDDPAISLPTGGASSNVTASATHNGIFDFNESNVGTPAIKGLKTTVNSSECGNNIDIALDPADAANKVLMLQALPTEGTSNRAAFTASKVAPTTANCYVLEYDFLLKSYSAGSLQIKLIGANNETIFNIETYYRDYTMSFRNKTAATDAKTEDRVYFATASLSSGWNTLRFEYYAKEGKIQIYLDNSYLTETTYYYSEDNRYAALSSSEFYLSKNSNCLFYLDDVTVAGIEKTYESQSAVTPPPSVEGGDPEDPKPEDPKPDEPKYNGTYDFTNDLVGDITQKPVNGLTASLGTGSASVLEAPINDSLDKVLYVATKDGSVTELKFETGKITDGEKAMNVLEFDFMFADITKGSSSTCLRFQIGSSYLLCLSLDSKNGKFSIKDSTTTNLSSNPNGWSTEFEGGKGIDAFAWHKLRIEYSVTDGAAAISVYLDGNLIGTSTNYWNQYGTVTEAPYDFSTFTIYCLKSLEYSFFIDNIVAKEIAK